MGICADIEGILGYASVAITAKTWFHYFIILECVKSSMHQVFVAKLGWFLGHIISIKQNVSVTLLILHCRLSEPNMASISGQLEELYMTHSRKHMNDTLTATLMDACVTASAMPSRLMMEHVLLVSILHHTVGIEVHLCHLE